jgi:AcrR family transcriptional regulator
MPRTMMDRFEQRKATRAKLVDAALQLFSTSGYEHATVDDISQAAGYSKGAYYFHFSTKDDILLELLRMWTEDRNTHLAGAGEAAVTREGLRDVLAGFFSYATSPRWPGVLLEFWAQAMRNQEVSKRLTEAYAVWRKNLAEAFEAARGSGVITAAAADAAAVALAAHDGYAVQVAIGAPGAKAMTPADLAESLLQPLETAIVERQAAAR